MVPNFFRETLGGEVLFILLAAVLSVAISQAVVFIFNRVLKTLTRKTSTTLDDLLIEALQRPIFLLVFIFGIYIALTAVAFLDSYQAVINRALLTAELILVIYGANRVAVALMTWYATEIAPRIRGDLANRLLPVARRLITGTIYAIGGLMVLRALGLDVSPLLAGLGIGGLAVALALQPTLSNLIAGAYTVSESKIGVGDYIRLEEGQLPEGTVVDIGWRTTKIHTPQGNTVIIPNSKLADAIVTNYNAPTLEMSAAIDCGVSYESDLALVEKVCQDVCREVIQELPDSVVVKEFVPSVRFRQFGDSNIDFRVVLRGKDRGSTFLIAHEVIKRLHARFAKEGITINYPVRRIIYTQGDDTPPRP